MTLTTWAAPAPRLPSLVEAARASRELSWREFDAHRGSQRQTKDTQGHGTPARYSEGCRCSKCVANRRKRQAAVEARRLARVLQHGTCYAYSQGCRCQPCSAAKVADIRAYKRRKQAMAEVADALAVRGGGGVMSRRSR